MCEAPGQHAQEREGDDLASACWPGVSITSAAGAEGSECILRNNSFFSCCGCLCELRWNLQKVDFATVAHDSDSGLGKLWQKMHERSDLHVLNHGVRFETLLPEDVPMVNVVMSGPPVNSMVDAKGGWGSPDSEPLMHTVSVMIDMERRPSSCFLAFALELTDKYGPYEKPLKELKDYLKKEFRGWCIWADESWTHSHGLPLDRCRRRGPRLLSRSRLR